MYKGYQGGQEYLRVVLPRKKPANRMMPLEDIAFNRKVSADRIIVEIFFVRRCGLWAITSNKYRWKEENYDYIFSLCVSLTSFHIKHNPLRAEDSEHYGLVKKRLYGIGEETIRKRKRTQERFRQRRKQRMDIRFRLMNASDDENVTQAPR